MNRRSFDCRKLKVSIRRSNEKICNEKFSSLPGIQSGQKVPDQSTKTFHFWTFFILQFLFVREASSKNYSLFSIDLTKNWNKKIMFSTTSMLCFRFFFINLDFCDLMTFLNIYFRKSVSRNRPIFTLAQNYRLFFYRLNYPSIFNNPSFFFLVQFHHRFRKNGLKNPAFCSTKIMRF